MTRAVPGPPPRERCHDSSSAARAGSTPTSGRSSAPASRRSPAPTRPAVAPAPAPWSWPRSCCPTGRAARCPGWPTPSCSPPAARDRVYDEVLKRGRSWSVVVIPAAARSTGSACTSATSRACGAPWRSSRSPPAYVLTDGFPVRGLPAPGPGGLEGRPGQRLDRGGVGAREGHPGPHHGRAARAAGRTTTSSGTRATSRRCTTPRSTRTGRAPSTGSPTSTWPAGRAATRGCRPGPWCAIGEDDADPASSTLLTSR